MTTTGHGAIFYNVLADQIITVNITARTVYGARNGLETLRQLITTHGRKLDGKTPVIAGDVEIVDEPVYPHRGFMLDTSRNYFPLSAIKRTIDAMGHSKLNVFHWHATDSHSFPLHLPSAPQMATWDVIIIHNYVFTIVMLSEMVSWWTYYIK